MISSLDWYAIRVRSNLENTTTIFLQSIGYDVFLPTCRAHRKWSDRIKDVTVPLFNGYLFCRMDITKRLPVLQAPGVVHIVGCGKTMIPVPGEEIAAVRRMVDLKLAVQPWPYQPGDTVRLHQGPLAGVEGVVVKLKSCARLIICIHLLQRAVATEVDLNWVERTNDRLSQTVRCGA